MLEPSKILLLNCIGSYYSSIIASLSGTSQNLILNFLANGHLAYTKLELEQIYKKFGTNPWGYQPVLILDNTNRELKIDRNFYDYLFSRFQIKTTIIEPSVQNFIDILTVYKTHEKTFIICTIDEFYNSHSKFYKLKHNKHFLLIKEYDSKNEEVTVIDSEKKNPYILPLIELEYSIFNSSYKHKSIHIINCSNFQNRLFQNLEDAKNNLIINTSEKYIPLMIENIISFENANDKTKKYIIEGYYYNIISKILPYLNMVRYTISNCRDNNSSEITLNELIGKWTNLNAFILYKLNRSNCDINPFVRKLEQISEIDQKFCDEIKTNNIIV